MNKQQDAAGETWHKGKRWHGSDSWAELRWVDSEGFIRHTQLPEMLVDLILVAADLRRENGALREALRHTLTVLLYDRKSIPAIQEAERRANAVLAAHDAKGDGV